MQTPYQRPKTFLRTELTLSGGSYRGVHWRIVSAPDKILAYNQATTPPLVMHAFLPSAWDASDTRAAIVFFSGGGWIEGNITQFLPQSRYLANRGMVAICADYRTQVSHGTGPFAAIEDGKSAIRYVRDRAASLGIDPNRIVAAGGSAGGHVAASTATVEGLDSPLENLKISSRPDALVLFNPVIDTSADGYGHELFGRRWRSASPLHNIAKDTPPTLIQHGTADTTTPFANAAGFETAMQQAGKRCELVGYDGEDHGFFNWGRRAYPDTVREMDRFLVSLGYLDPEGSP